MIKLYGCILLVFFLGYPAAALLTHGLDPTLWPTEVVAPGEWFGYLPSVQPGKLFFAYWQMMIGRSQAFANGGIITFACLLAPIVVAGVLVFFGKPLALLRDESGLYGTARFATSSEMSTMSQGLELGINPETGTPVRVKVQGTLVTIAPPRMGKTSGFLIPNLAFPESQSWDGPAVVLDTKGEVYRAVGDRRRALGREVVCLDPLDLVQGNGRWNPLAKIDPADVLYMQRTALALLPEGSGGGDEASAYFRNKAVDLLTGAMFVALQSETRTPSAMQYYLANDNAFIAALKMSDAPAARAALDIMEADPKTRDPIKATASQALQWLADDRLQELVSRNSFNLSDLSSGNIDLFIAIPPEYKRILAPFLRWLLSDIFASIRRNRPKERVLVFVDEAAALGRFDEILTAAGELPGYGGSLWTFWQDRSQIIALYGEAGASTILNTAEVVTIFNLPAVDPDETERWSRTIGDYTALVATSSQSGSKETKSKSWTPQAARLMAPSALITMPKHELLAFVNGGGRGSHPIKLRKTVAHIDPRFERLVQSTPPVGTTG
ncbi:type IV secretory system conjugative DNA transfer family protein [Beijerinckia sp. L45]|uniref:type IV secretory system conjugative DNA transfer family protein n=1 Tax=Beijerinckia sp. L45 TaxID=1641855 RepID=UPI00131D0453|nr:type IV secretory system conjugative DNA transfer family protein [Beijerinckia sp. L45]